MTSTHELNKPTPKFYRQPLLLLAAFLSLTLPAWFLSDFGSSASATSHNNKSLSIVLIGDSYTAGNGAGSYHGPWGSYQSSQNWGNKYNDWLKTNGVKSTLTNLAFSGKEAREINTEQVPEIPQNTDLVMFTAGGNDTEFSTVVEKCFAKGLRSSEACRNQVNNAKSKLPTAISNTKTILKSLESKLPSTSQVVLVGYPLLSLDNTDYQIKTCVEREGSFISKCKKWDIYKAADAVRQVGKEFNKKQAELVNSWNQSSSLKVTFVDTQTSFSTHEPHPSPDERNPIRWINEFFESEGNVDENGNTVAKTNGNLNNWYHPNIIGHEEIALNIINQVGVPSSAKEITPTSSDTDIVFVIDTTGSMGWSINRVKEDVNQIATQIKNMSKTTRFSLISYRDHPTHTFDPSDYPAKTHLNFTHEISPFIAAVNTLQLGNGGDWPESVYSGSMNGLNQSWRPGVRKIMIILGDAAPHDPEPITGYTWQQVAQLAYDIDPVEIYAVDVGGLSSPEIVQLTSQTGGKIINSWSSDIPSAIIESVSDSLAKPFGWIQGPYVIKTGESLELDGRGSYAVDGEIEKIEWDLDGDGVFEITSSDLMYTHTFTKEFSGTIGLRITDSNGNIGIGSTQLDVTDDGDTVPRHIDNCPDIANPSQFDSDGDGIGDDCDDDIGWPTEDMEGVYITYGEEDVEPAPAEPATEPAQTAPSKSLTPTFPLTSQLASTSTSSPWLAATTQPNNNPLSSPPQDILSEPAKPAKSTDEQPSNWLLPVSIVAVILLIIASLLWLTSRKSRQN